MMPRHTRSSAVSNSNSNSPSISTTTTGTTTITDPACRSKQNKVMFPWLLHEVLNDAASNHLEHIVAWNPSGLSFKVHDREAFTQQILPRYFSQTKYKSYVRQLNMWCFSCVHGGRTAPERGSYRHPCFVRGRPEMCGEMKRCKLKSASAAAKAKATGAKDCDEAPPAQQTSTEDGLLPVIPHVAVSFPTSWNNETAIDPIHELALLPFSSPPPSTPSSESFMTLAPPQVSPSTSFGRLPSISGSPVQTPALGDDDHTMPFVDAMDEMILSSLLSDDVLFNW
eukprot:CAMPEP_0119572642 /NCGR_PEP_ID=MMETSP1352-20130426/44719_1 /TAXON_ID=265584 /ORGANISM="Stauroneis constricta, Strain CCMP1120" /LENGTH=281 /DNA_ID=CAMNT_0007622327 /DNA_START=1200 /DNA_END=2045 /DNA_ORIENTATION=+